MALTQVIAGMDGAGSGGAGSGDVVGPASSTDNAIARFDGLTGKKLQNSTASIDDSGNLTLNGSYNLVSNIGGGILAFGTYSLSTLNQPLSSYPVTTYGSIEANGLHGGVSISGLTDNGDTAIGLNAFVGNTVLTNAAMYFIASKTDGAGGQQALGAAERVMEINNGGSTPTFKLFGNGDVNLFNILRNAHGVAIGNPLFTTTPPTDGLTVIGRVQESYGDSVVTAANDTTLATRGNTFTVQGNTTINGIATASWIAGNHITLIFTGSPTVKHNTAASAGFARIFLEGSTDLAAAPNTVLKLVFDGTQWQQECPVKAA